MNAVVILLVGIVILVLGYIFYGGWLAKQWGVDPKRTTPAHELEDGNDYVPAKAPVLMGHHFSSIAGAGPINGPIQAAVFGWVPVMLWVLIGGIFFGAVHDFGALFASVRNKGQSIGEVIAESIGSRAKKLFLTFSYLTLILVVAAFASIVANTFKATYTECGKCIDCYDFHSVHHYCNHFRYDGIQKKCISGCIYRCRCGSNCCLYGSWLQLASDLLKRKYLDGNRGHLHCGCICYPGLDSASAA